ncbi:phytase [Clostridium sp. HBUAS56017]|uniref:phytase n=1 Tax=Clostridium sp. HBUAS56017 TaxID=2571128 RepID=UPI001177A7BC|nr:phytase [Clostridium sp. HBUAS56017]
MSIKKNKANIALIAILTVSTVAKPTSFMANAAEESMVTVYPTIETTSVHHPGDYADDTCIWVDPEDKDLSLIIGDDKHGGICVWNLDGTERQYIDGKSYMNNLDIRYNFKLGNQVTALVGSINESDQCISFYKVNPVTRLLESVGNMKLYKEKPYGGCMYHNPYTGKFYFFANWKDGTVEQWEINGESGSIDGTMVREFNVGSQVEGCVADDELSTFYIGEEDVGLWKYSAEPDGGNSRAMIDSTDSSIGGHLTADVEGVTLYHGKEKDKGYIICSSQGNSTFQVYERKNNKYKGSFTIGATLKIDEVTETDGCDVSNVNLGGEFSKGVFIAHDHSNDGTENSNHKLVPWKDIADKLNLDVSTDYDPTDGANHKPKIKDVGDKEVNVNEKLKFQISAKDKDNNTIDYYCINLPYGAKFDINTHEFTWKPNDTQKGTYYVTFYVTDGYNIDKEKVKIEVK